MELDKTPVMQQVPFLDLKAGHAQIEREVQEALSAVLDGMDLLHGPNTRAFEAEFAAFCRSRYAVGVGSGTDALYLALRACGVAPGDEVITVSHSFFATAEAILLVGAVPVYIDVDPTTYTMDVNQLEAAIGPRARAIVPVHLYGQMADMEAITTIARRHGLAVVEDASQAPGAQAGGARAGTAGDAAAFSFHPGNVLGAYGEAGAVVTSSRAVADEVRLLRDHGSRQTHEHVEIGLNSQLDELQAAILRVKLRVVDTWIADRIVRAQTYTSLLEGAPVTTPAVPSGNQHVFQHYVIQVGERDRVREALANRGIETEVLYPIPIHLQEAASGSGRTVGDLRVTTALAQRVLSLPMYPTLKVEQLSYVAAGLRDHVV